MGETIIEKIIRHNTGKAVKPGDIVTVNVDRVMIHDIFIPFVAEKFEEMGFQKLWDPDKVVLIYDHLVPASQQDDTRHFHVGDAFAAKYGMKNVHRSDGICHQLMTEAGYVKPGNIVFGTDSHTTTYGCVGAFSSGIGYTEMASILGTGTMWIKVPETIKVVIDGELPENVMSKDIILRLIGDLRADGATYRALEFCGPLLPIIIPPVGKSGPGIFSIRSRYVQSGLSIRYTMPSQTSDRLWGGIFVAIPTAIPVEPFIKILGILDGKTEGSVVSSL